MLKRYAFAALLAGFGTSYSMEKEPSKTTYVESIIGMLKSLLSGSSGELEDARQLSGQKGLYFSMLPKDILGMVQYYRLNELLDRALDAQDSSETLTGIQKLAQFPEYTQVFSNPKFVDGIINRISNRFGIRPEGVAQAINTQVARLWLTQIRPQARLLVAACRGDLATVQQLIASGVNVNAQSGSGKTALIGAAEGADNTEVVNMLIKAGADVNACDDQGETALIYAAKIWHTKVVKLLIASGANVNARDKLGCTALMWAAPRGNAETLKELIAAGADANPQDNNGWPALMYAAEKGRTEIVQLILEAGADVNAQDKYGKTALDLAERRAKSEIIKLLKKAPKK